MKILALEFSSAQRSAAVVESSPGKAPVLLGTATETGDHKTKAFHLIEQALRSARLEREQIDCLAVGLGPGSYTGIRVAISVAQGWQLAREVKLLGVSSVECLAAQAQVENILGRVNIVIDAQRKELYLAGFEISAAVLREVEPLHLETLVEALVHERSGELVVGPEVTRWFPQGRVLFPAAAMVGRLAARSSDFVAGEKLEPIYLRETSFVKAAPPRTLL